ncbi:MAG: S26 family signal peptidase [Stellaceae bacterium]
MKRDGWAIAATTAAGLALWSSVFHPAPKLLWNATASVPIGLYGVGPARPLRVGELVIVAPPNPLAGFLVRRRYLGFGVPLVKHILALAGARVCREGGVITVNGAVTGKALDRDRFGRPLPAWQGCRVLEPGQVFLMNRKPLDSLDGRYFGPLRATTIVGRAHPIWTFPRS